MPQQARSNELVAVVLRAAIQVLAKEGAQRFTMARVAERAGVSVGSLYQYFPNKAAILFRLQSDEWRQTSHLMSELLKDSRRAPLERLRALVHAFVQSECDEATVRIALNDAAPLYRDAPEAHEVRQSSEETVKRFMREALPDASEAVRTLAGDLVTTTLSAVGKDFSENLRTSDEIHAHADALADMVCAYLSALSSPSARDEERRSPGRLTSTGSSSRSVSMGDEPVIHRGDVFWIAPDESRGPAPSYSHPHVVVQDDVFNHSRIASVVVCALTTNLAKANEPGNLLLDPGEGGLPKRSAVVVSQISSVERSRLGARIGALSDERVEEILAGLRFLQRSFFTR